jgi:hypothetical protein
MKKLTKFGYLCIIILAVLIVFWLGPYLMAIYAIANSAYP